jgi:ferredoxin/flavodoxin---NADP+ reductase
MTDHLDDPRVIDPAAPQYNARLVRRVDITPELGYFWVKFDGPATPFEAGQYMTTGVFADGKLVQRPYSVASAPGVADSEGYELFVRLVPILRFTTLLWRLPVGHEMRMIGPKGRFMLEPDDQRTHLYVSTGTGIAPFVSMIRQSILDGAPRRTILLNGVSYAEELGYRDEMETHEAEGTYPLTYVPTVSRAGDPRNAGWHGRTGRVEAIIEDVRRELDLQPERTVVYICGNPDMILNVERDLMARGFPEFHVKKELYWPKGKDATAAESAVPRASKVTAST